MKNALAVVISLAVIFLMTGCDKSEADKAAEAAKIAEVKINEQKAKQATFQFLVEERAVSRNNAERLAAAWRASNPIVSGMVIEPHSDSTISASCPQGDGWATVTFISREGNKARQDTETITAYCSTVDPSLGCYLKSEFQSKRFAEENDKCNDSLPSPLPRFK